MPLQYDLNGITTQTLSEIIDERELALQPYFGSDLQLTADTAIGNIQITDADREIAIQDLLAYLTLQMSVENSSGRFLDWNAQFKNLIRIAPSKTRISRTINGTVGTVILANSLTITDDVNGYDFTLINDVTVSTNGKVQGIFDSRGYDVITINGGDSFSIATPLVGINSITFEIGDSTVMTGRNTETDEEFRARVINSNLAGSIGISQAIVDKIKQLDGVISASYIENTSSVNYLYEEYSTGTGTITTPLNAYNLLGTGTAFLTELNTNYAVKYEDENSDIKAVVTGASLLNSNTVNFIRTKNTTITTGSVPFEYAPPTLPPNSFEIIVLGGDEDEIANVIMNNKVPTTQTYGTTIILASDSEGQGEYINFTKVSEIDLALECDVYYTSALSVAEQNALKQEFVTMLSTMQNENSSNGIGMDIDADDFAVISNTLSKIKKIRNILINRPTEAQTDYIDIKLREIARLDIADITINLISA